MKTGRCSFFTVVWLTAVCLLVVPDTLVSQGVLDPNTIPVTLRLLNSDPVALSHINGGSQPGMRTARIFARRNPPGTELFGFADVSILGASVRSFGITVESDPAGYTYALGHYSSGAYVSYVDFVPPSGASRYYLNRLETGPVLPLPAMVAPVSLDLCVGVLVLQFPADGSPFPITGGTVRAYASGTGALRAEVTAMSPGVGQAVMFVPSNEPLTVVVQYATGGDPEVDRISYEDRFAITLPCDSVVVHIVPRPATAELGRISGRVDMEGEMELAGSRVFALNGPLGNRREFEVPPPYAGAFTLPNMVPSSLTAPPLGYEVYAQLYLQREGWFASFRSPTLGRGSNPSVFVSPGAVTDLGDTFVFRPGYVQGRLLLHGPPESCLGYLSALRSLVDSAGPALQSYVFAQVNGEETPSNVGGDARASFAGSFRGGDTFDGSYRLAVAGFSRGGSVWNRGGLSVLLRSGSPAEPDSYVEQRLSISELINPRFRTPYGVGAGETITNDLSYALSRVIVDLDVVGGMLWSPTLEQHSSGGLYTPNGGTDFQGNYRWYQAFVVTAAGTPSTPSVRGQVVVYLPEGEFTLKPFAHVSVSGSSTLTQFPEIPLRIGRGQCIRVAPCLRIKITNSLVCPAFEGTPIRGQVLTGCTNPVARIEWSRPGGATNVVCEGCGLNPSFSFVLPTSAACADHPFTVTAYDEAGRVSSITDVVPRDRLAPTIHYPTNLVVACTGNGGANVSYSVTATDDCALSPSVVCLPPAGSFFPQGETSVHCSASDRCQNQSTCEFKVTVMSNCPPACLVLACPTNLVVPCQTPNGAPVYYDVRATNRCSGQPVTMSCSPLPGSFLPIGQTEAVCVARSEGETQECRFIVTVLNECRPNDCVTLSCPNLLVWNCSGIDGSRVPYTVIASNRCVPADLRLTCYPPSESVFRPGLTTVHCVATGSSQTVDCEFPVLLLGARPWRGHTLGYRFLGDASLTFVGGGLQVSNASSNSMSGLAFDLPEALNFSFNLNTSTGAEAGPPNRGAILDLAITDLNDQLVALLDFHRVTTGFVAKATYPGLLSARNRILALDTNGSLLEFSNVTSLNVESILGARVEIAATERQGLLISAHYLSPVQVIADTQPPIQITALIWSAEPAFATSTSSVRLASCAISSYGFPPLIVSDMTPEFEPMPTISGRILDDRAGPVPEVKLYLSGIAEPAATTDAKGYFAVTLPARCVRMDLTPIKPFHRFTPDTIALPAGGRDLVTNFSAVTPFRSWQANYWGTNALESTIGPRADPDGDELPNILEYATGGNPTLADAPRPGPLTITLTNSGGRYWANLNINVADYATDLQAEIQATDTLSEPTWRTVDGPFPCLGPGGSCRILPVDNPDTGGAGMFYRMELVCNDCVPTLVPSQTGSDHFKLAYYNTQTLPLIPGIAGGSSTTSGCCEDIPDRLTRLRERLAQPEIDVVALAEVFGVRTGGAPEQLAVGLRDAGFQHFVKYLGGPSVEIPIPILPNPRIRGESGLMLFSRFEFFSLPPRFAVRYRPNLAYFMAESAGRPFLDVGFVQFTGTTGNDAFSRKGAGLVRIRHPRSRRIFTVVFTHLQNGTTSREILIRESQLGQIKTMIEALLTELREDPNTREEDTQVFLVGDLNINGDPRFPECFDSTREWENFFGPGVNSSVIGDFFKNTLHDVWARQNQHVTAPVGIEHQDRGLTQSIHRSGADPDSTCSLYVPPGPDGRVDYLFMNSSRATYPLEVQQMALAVNLRTDSPYFDAAIGSRGHQELSDHYGIIADINRRGPNSSPQQAELLVTPATGNSDGVHVQSGRLEFPGSMRWYRINDAGTYDIGVLPGATAGANLQVRVFDTRCLSVPLRPVAGSRRVFQRNGRDVRCEAFDVPEGPVLLRVLSPDETSFGAAGGDFDLLVRRREGIGQSDAVVLGPNRGPMIVDSPNTFSSSAVRWFIVDTLGAFSRRNQRMGFYLTPGDPGSRYGLSLMPRFGVGGVIEEAGPEAADPTNGQLQMEHYQSASTSFFLAVTAYAPTLNEAHAYEIGWNNNLTVIHRFYPQYTPGPMMPIEVKCHTQVNDDVQIQTDPFFGVFPVGIETSVDDPDVYFDIGDGFQLRHANFLNPYLLARRMDGGQVVTVREMPMAFLDDEQAVVEVIAGGPGRRGSNVLRAVINPLPANVSTSGAETVFLEPHRAWGGQGKYSFNFYRTHGIPFSYEP